MGSSFRACSCTALASGEEGVEMEDTGMGFAGLEAVSERERSVLRSTGTAVHPYFSMAGLLIVCE